VGNRSCGIMNERNITSYRCWTRQSREQQSPCMVDSRDALMLNSPLANCVVPKFLNSPWGVFSCSPRHTHSRTQNSAYMKHVELTIFMPYSQHKQKLSWRSGWLQADASPSRPGLGPVLPPCAIDTGKSSPGGTKHEE